MRTAAVLILASVPLGGCSHRDYYGEEFSNRYQGPAEETRQQRVERREIVHWGSNPKDKVRIGFLWKMETQVAGSRNVREGWYIVNRTGTARLGYITAEGKFYRFTKRERGTGDFGDFVGEYPILTGLKVFFGYPMRDNVDLEEIDPYK